MRARITHVVTVPESLVLFRGQLRHMRARGYEIDFVCSPAPALADFAEEEGVRVHAVEMTRRITPGADARALAQLALLVRSLRPDVVHAHTPKAGLLGTTAAWLTRTRRRIYHLRGLPLVTARGGRRAALEASERASCGLATHVLAVSDTLRAEVVRRGLVRPEKVRVLGHGSGNGVDARTRFDPARHHIEREVLRRSLGVRPGDVVVGFVGRVARDKGVGELTRALERLRAPVHLMVVGADEPHDPVDASTRATLGGPRVHRTGHVRDVERYYAAMDVFVLPSHREGFPNVVLEASAMALPVVATRVPGCSEAVLDGESGTLVDVGDVDAIAEAVGAYAGSAELRRAHGTRGRAHVLATFDQAIVWGALARFYEEVLST